MASISCLRVETSFRYWLGCAQVPCVDYLCCCCSAAVVSVPSLVEMGSQVSYPVLVESVRPGLYCARWRMADSVRDFRHYANAFRLPGNGTRRRPRTYNITATWLDGRYAMLVEAGPVVVVAPALELEQTTNEEHDFEDLPNSLWISYGGGTNQMLSETLAGSWRIDDVQFNTSIGQLPFFARFPYSRPWAGCGLTFRLWLDFQPRGKSEKNALRQLSDLFVRQENCDVTFVVQGERIGAHLAVVAARSHVMAAMFRHDMRESRTRQVVIEDCAPDVFRLLVHFLYCGRAYRLSEHNAQWLLLAADKYAVDDLREECLAVLRSAIRLDNALDTLFWAHANCVQGLADSALDYITQHAKEIHSDSSDCWQLMAKSCPELSRLIASKQSLASEQSVISL